MGEIKAEEITSNAIYVLSMGSNDFLQNYYRELVRSQEFSPEQYVNFLAARMLHAVQVLSLSLSAKPENWSKLVKSNQNKPNQTVINIWFGLECDRNV